MSSSLAPLRLLIFDERRGNKEGRENEKIIAFYPGDIVAEEQVALVGLIQGLLQFASCLSPSIEVEQKYELIENDASIWYVEEWQDSIFFGFLATKAWFPRHVTFASIQSLSKHITFLISMMLGGVQQLLNKDQSGYLARASVGKIFEQVGEEILLSTSWVQKELRNPFNTLGAARLAKLAPSISTDAVCLVHRMQLIDCNRKPVVSDAMVVHDGLLLWSSFPCKEAAKFCSLIRSGILNPVSTKRSLNDDLSQPLTKLESGFYIVRRDSSVSGHSEVQDIGQRSQIKHLMPAFYVTHGVKMPVLLYEEDAITVLATLYDDARISTSNLENIKDVLRPLVRSICNAVEREELQRPMGHMPGWRYARNTQHYVSATPRSKVSTMTHHARAVASALRNSVVMLDKSVTVFARSFHGVWTAVQYSRSKEEGISFVVHEKKFHDGVEGSMREISHFIDTIRTT